MERLGLFHERLERIARDAKQAREGALAAAKQAAEDALMDLAMDAEGAMAANNVKGERPVCETLLEMAADAALEMADAASESHPLMNAPMLQAKSRAPPSPSDYL